ncbi:MAG TPA: hypothetical protein VMS96_04200 [Terriglobales bacterium]|nr:hypothetical protein [Terriglobales bacterium]
MRWLMFALCVLVFVSLLVFGQTPGRKAVPIPPQERGALIALYNSSQGENWKKHDGWLGPVGTECMWYGVRCDFGIEGGTVTSIDLLDNNLTGKIPDELGGLTHLEWLNVLQNHLSGRFPELLLQRWIQGELQIAGEPRLFTAVSEVDFESVATSILCAQHRIIVRSDGSAIQYTERCRAANPKDRRTFCEIRHGRVWPGDFARLGFSLEWNGFFSLRSNYERDITHGNFRSMRVIAGDKTHEVVEYAGGGPLQLWAFQMAIEGIAGQAEWNNTTTRSDCPRWEPTKKSAR